MSAFWPAPARSGSTRSRVFAALIAAGMSGAPCGAADPAAPTPEVFGRVGGMEIRTEEFRTFLANLAPHEQAALTRDPSLLSQLVRAFMAQRLLLKEAQAKQWDRQPQVAARLTRVRESALIETYLEAVTAPPPGYPGEEELRRVYEASRAALLVPRSFRLAQIFVAELRDADKAISDKARAKVDSIRRSLQAPGVDFAAVARAESEERTSAARGGEIGWLSETQIQPEIREQLPKLVLGVVSEPIRLDDGWHMLKVLDVREPHTPTFDQIRPRLAQQLRAERVRAESQAYLAKLLQDNPPKIEDAALSRILTDVSK